jgi:hypothetical protein
LKSGEVFPEQNQDAGGIIQLAVYSLAPAIREGKFYTPGNLSLLSRSDIFYAFPRRALKNNFRLNG